MSVTVPGPFRPPLNTRTARSGESSTTTGGKSDEESSLSLRLVLGVDFVGLLSAPDLITGFTFGGGCLWESLDCVCSWIKLSSFLKGVKKVFLKKVLVLLSSLASCLWAVVVSDVAVVAVVMVVVVLVSFTAVVLEVVVITKGRSNGRAAKIKGMSGVNWSNMSTLISGLQLRHFKIKGAEI